jgi:hypothetical protein
LKTIKNELLSNCPKNANSVMFKLMNATDENLLAESQFNASMNKRSSANSTINLTNQQNQGKGVLGQRQKSARNLPSTTNLNKEQLNQQYKPQTFLKAQ